MARLQPFLFAALPSLPIGAQTWQPGFGSPSSGGAGFSDGVYAITSFDDGTGSKLYAGGPFLSAGGATVHGLAQQTATGWTDVGGGISGASGYISCMAVFDDGSGPALYVGGNFTTAGGISAISIARWNGAAWSNVGTGMVRSNGNPGEVFDLVVWDDGSGPALYAAGRFATAGGTPAQNLARWRAGAWSEFGGGYNGIYSGGCCPYKLHVHDDGTGPALFVAGEAATVGGSTAIAGVGKWNGTTWSALGTGLTGGPFNFGAAMATFDDGTGPALYVGGDFAQAGGIVTNHIARWNGVSWSALGNGLSGTPFPYGGSGLAVFDDGGGPRLYVSGLFETAGTVASAYVARWNGSTWEGLAGGLQGGSFVTGGPLHVHSDALGPQLYVSGTFELAGGMPSLGLAAWSSRQPLLSADGGSLSALAGGTRSFDIRFGGGAAGQLFGLLGSISGDAPGTPLPVGTLWLNAPLVTLLVGALSANGDAAATLTLPAGTSPSLVGVAADLAAVTISPSLQIAASNRVQLRVVN